MIQLFLTFGFVTLLMILLRLLFKKDFIFTSNYNLSEEYDETVSKIQNSIFLALKKSNCFLINQKENCFTAYTLISIWSFSEIIKVEIIDDGSIKKVNYTSSCYFHLQIIDWGKNKRNAKAFFKNLDEILKF